MEMLTAGALSIVIYCVYVTVKDIVADLRLEEMGRQAVPVPVRCRDSRHVYYRER